MRKSHKRASNDIKYNCNGEQIIQDTIFRYGYFYNFSYLFAQSISVIFVDMCIVAIQNRFIRQINRHFNVFLHFFAYISINMTVNIILR